MAKPNRHGGQGKKRNFTSAKFKKKTKKPGTSKKNKPIKMRKNLQGFTAGTEMDKELPRKTSNESNHVSGDFLGENDFTNQLVSPSLKIKKRKEKKHHNIKGPIKDKKLQLNKVNEAKGSCVDDADIVFQSAKEQLHWFIESFQASANIKYSSLELQEIPENAMVSLSSSWDHSIENLSKHTKFVFGSDWKEVLYHNNLKDDIVAGSPALLVICSSALRCTEILRGLKELTAKCHAVKLFGKHLKIENQADILKGRVNIAVGTPSRIMKLIEIDSLKILRLSVLIFDTNKDAKGQTLFSLPQVKDDFWKLYRTYFHEQLMKSKLQLCLY